jgi:hypothetical protein
MASHPGTTVARHVPASAGASGNDPEAGWRRARAWHSLIEIHLTRNEAVARYDL